MSKNSREIIIAAIKRGRSNEEALAAARKKFPNTTTTLATVNWIRNQVRKTHPAVKSDRAARQSRGR